MVSGELASWAAAAQNNKLTVAQSTANFEAKEKQFLIVKMPLLCMRFP
jgi:hypothetical protein